MPEATPPHTPPARIAALLFGLLLFSLAFQGARGLWEPDEGRYTNVAVEMIALDDWLVPHQNHETEHWTKPPLTYWAIATSLEAFGRTELAARLTSALSYFATAVLLGLLGRIFLPRLPWLAAPLYAASVLPFVASNLVTTDTLLALWECLGVYAFARAAWHPACRRRAGWLMVMWAAFGLAFLTKGPPGLLPLLAIVGFSLSTPRLRRSTGLKAWPGLVVLLAVALPWYIIVTLKNPGLLDYFINKEVVARVASDDFRRHSEWYGAFKVYLPTLLVGLLPWTWWWLRAAGRGLNTWRHGGRQAFRALDEKQRFLLWWLLLPLAVFFLARSRLPLYVLPLAAPLVLVTARELLRNPGFPSRATPWLLTAWMVALLALRAASGWVHSPKDARATAEMLRAAGVNSCQEIAFYETRPMLGLRFYLGCEIESIDRDGLEQELAEPERRYWAVNHDSAPEFESRMRAARRGIGRVAEVPGRWLLYRENGHAADTP
ncbi:MAG: glycosyltransferase family 39 protein [Lysobacterales bacterium]|jgi:4-amino-4-deoxy-L-arabinose transferase